MSKARLSPLATRPVGAAWLAMLLVSLGCHGAAGPERFPASGSATLDGVPLTNASVIFEPQASGGILAAAVIVDGQFAWTAGDGPTAGEYHVRINPHALEEDEALAVLQQNKRQPIEHMRLPDRYQRPGALTATVAAGQPNRFEFHLKSK